MSIFFFTFLWIKIITNLRYWSRRFRKHLEERNSGRMTEKHDKYPEGFDCDRENSKVKLRRTNSSFLVPQDHANTSVAVGDSGVDGNTCHRRSISPNSASTSPVTSPRFCSNRAISTGFALENGDSLETNDSSRRGSAVGKENFIKTIDNSAWGESMRRSFVTRRTD